MRIVLLLGFASVLLAMLALLLTSARLGSELACDRASGACSLTQQRWAETSHDLLPLGSIDRAEVRVPRGRGGSPQVWVITTRGDYFFADYVLRPSADRVAQSINDFLASTCADARLVLSDDTRAGYWTAWALVPLVVVLLVVLASALFRKPASPAQA